MVGKDVSPEELFILTLQIFSMRLLVETVEGFERTCEEELEDISENIEVEKRMEGYMVLEAGKEDVFRINYLAGTLNRVLHVLNQFKVEKTEDCYKKISFNVSEFIEADQEFVVKVEKQGCDFSSNKLARETGQKVVDLFKDETGKTLSVDLDKPEMVFRLYIFDDEAFFGFDTTKKSLNKRGYLEKEVDIPPILANCLVRYSGWDGETKLLDPFTKDGVVAVEAARIASRTPNKGRKFGFVDSKYYSNKKYSEIANRINSQMKVGDTGVKGCEKDISNAVRHAESAGVKVNFEEKTALEHSLKDYHVVFDTPFLPRKSKRKLIADYISEFENKAVSSGLKSLTCTSRDPGFYSELEKDDKVVWNTFEAHIFEMDG